MVLSAVQDAKDHQILPGDAKGDFVGKAVSEDAPETPVVEREAFRAGLQAQQCFGEVGEEFIAQAGASFFIPVARPDEIGFGPGPDGDDPLHSRDSRSSRKTLRHGSPGHWAPY